jgi:peptide/nickel transport system permease protein
MSQIAASPGAPVPGPIEPAGQAEALTTRQRSHLQMVVARFLRHRLAVISLVVFLLIVAFAFLGPLLYPHGHTIVRGAPPNQPWFQDLIHPLGTNRPGQDALGLLMRGTQQTLKVVFTVAVISMAIAAVWGTAAGFYRGWVDAVMMRIADVVLIVPLLVLVTAIAGNVRGGTNWYSVALIIAAVSWATYARVIRAVVLSLREQEFIEAARAMGASDARILFRHLLPNSLSAVIVGATILIAITALIEAALSFLGFGIQPPDTSLGLQIDNARTAVQTRPWLFYPPGIMLVLVALTANFIGDGLRDALDPRQTMVRR